MKHLGWVTLALFLLAAFSGVADAIQMSGAQTRVSQGYVEATDTGVYHVNRQQAELGDVIRVYPERMLTGPFGSYSLAIVPGGDGDRYLTGGNADEFLRIDGLDPQQCCERDFIPFTVPTSDGWIDMVWIFAYTDGTSRPEGEAGIYFDNWVESLVTAAGESPGGQSTVVVKGSAITAHGFLQTIAITTSSIGLMTLILWLRAAAPAPRVLDPTDMAELSFRFLQRVRHLLLWLSPPVVLGLMGIALSGADALAGIEGPSADWGNLLAWAARIIAVGAMIAWGSQLWRVHHRLKLWAPPI